MNLNNIACKQNFNGLIQLRIGEEAKKPQGIVLSNIDDSYMNGLSEKHNLKKDFNFYAQYDPKSMNYIAELTEKIGINSSNLGEIYFICNDGNRIFIHAEKGCLEYSAENHPNTQKVRKTLDFNV